MHLRPALLLHLDAAPGDSIRDERMDPGRDAVPNLPSGALWERGRGSAEHGLHHREQVRKKLSSKLDSQENGKGGDVAVKCKNKNSQLVTGNKFHRMFALYRIGRLLAVTPLTLPLPCLRPMQSIRYTNDHHIVHLNIYRSRRRQ